MIGSWIDGRALTRALLLGAGLTLGFTPAWGQTPPDTSRAEQVAPSLAELRERIEERYQVLPLRGGIVLMPRYGDASVQSIELADGAIAIDGQPVTGAELRERIGEDAEDITRLSYLDTESRRVLFGIGPSPQAMAGDTAAAEAEGDTLAAAEEAEAEDEDDADEDHGVTQSDQVRVGGGIYVGPDEIVAGDVVAVGGSVEIDGRVEGDVVAVGGSVELGPDAVVEGEVTSVGGTIDRAPGARIEGSINEIAWGPHFAWGTPHVGVGPLFEGVGGLVATIIWIVVLGLLVSLALLIAARPIEKMEYRVATSPWKAAVVGLVAQLLFFPVLVLTCVILVISIIGIPLLLVVPFALFALAIGILLGFAAVAKHVGHSAERRFGWDHRNPYLSVLVGLGIIMALLFFGSALGMAGGPLDVFAAILSVLGFVILYAAWTIGFGVLLLTRFGTRYRWGNGETPVAAPTGPPPPPAEVLPTRGDVEGRYAPEPPYPPERSYPPEPEPGR